MPRILLWGAAVGAGPSEGCSGRSTIQVRIVVSVPEVLVLVKKRKNRRKCAGASEAGLIEI